MQDLHFLSKTAQEFLTLPSGANIHLYIAEKLREIVNQSIVSVSSYDPTSGSLIVRALVGLGKYSRAVIHLTGWNPLGMSFKIDNEEARSRLLSGELIEGPSGIHELTFGKVPQVIARKIEKLLTVGDIYGIGFSWGGRLYGSAMIAPGSATESLLQKKDTIEAFIRQASMALQRKETEDALRESEERLRFALEASSTGAWDLNLADHTVSRSLAYDRIFGYAEMLPEWTYEMFLEHVVPEDRETVDETFRHATATGSDWSFECRIKRVDGEVRWIWAAGRHRKNGSGSSRRMAGIIQDITGRKQIEEALRQAEEVSRARAVRLQATLDAEPSIVWIAQDRECRSITGNRVAERFFRVPKGTNLSKTGPAADRLVHFRLFHEGVELKPQEMPIRRVAASGKPRLDYTMDVHFNDGTVRSLQGNVVPLLAGSEEPCGAIAAFMDITERKRAEEALRDSERRSKRAAEVNKTIAELGRIIGSTLTIDEIYEQFALLVKSIIPFDRLRVAIIDSRQGNYFTAHCSGFKMPGRQKGDVMPLPRTVAEVVRKRSGILLHADEVKGFPEEYPSLLAPFQAGIRSTIVVPLISKDTVIGALFFGSLQSKAYTEDDMRLAESVARQISGAIANAQLFIQYKQSEEELRKYRDELEERVRQRTSALERKNQELQEFAFVASHDLSEPLRKIQGFGSLLKERASDRLSEIEKDYISRMAGSANRMQELLDALLRYSRVETKGQEFRPTRLQDVLKDLMEDLDHPIQKIAARVEIGPLPVVMGDPYQLRQLFQNLISNALKYHRTEAETHIKIFAKEGNGAPRILVEDNGIGFDEKYLDRIFRPFQRLHGRNEYPGLGIGLSICKKIVERHGGTITARSTPGKGSTFIVRLPTTNG